MLAWLSRLVAGVLVATLSGLIIALVIDHTLLNAKYLESEAKKANTYQRVSSALPADLTKDSSGDRAQAEAAVSQLVTPQLVQAKLTQSLNEVQAYYTGNGPAPTIDLRDVVAEARAAGLDIPADSGLNKPIVLTDKQGKAKALANQFKNSRLVTELGVIVLIALLLFLSWERHRYLVLPDILISSGVIIAIVSGAFLFLPNIIEKYAHIDTVSNTYVQIGRDLANRLAHDEGWIFAAVAVVLLVIGIAGRLGLGMMKKNNGKAAPSPAPAK
jgi:hypothetical protein